jgi:hypothetical protein
MSYSGSVARQLKKLVESHGVRKVSVTLDDAMKQKKIDPYAIQIPALAEAFLGHDAERKLRAVSYGQTHLLEAGEATDASAFAAITGQLLVTIVKEKYESADFIGEKLVKKYTNPGANLKEHKIPYLNDVASAPDKLSQGEQYPYAQFSGSYVEMPAPEKRGMICAITMEMMLSDLTGQAQDSAGSVGRSLGYQKEERILRVVLGITNPYKWSINATGDAGALNTYVSTAGTGGYVNKLLSSTITNYETLNSVEQLFHQMYDPVTLRRIYVRPTKALVMPEKAYLMKRVINATEIRSGDVTSGDGIQTIGQNPLDTRYEVLTSPIARALLDDETSLSTSEIKEKVWLGDFQKAFGYREVYAMKTETAPPMNPLQFNQDIVLAIKVSEFGVPFVFDPRYVVASTSEAA